jgi:hypothetical protein
MTLVSRITDKPTFNICQILALPKHTWDSYNFAYEEFYLWNTTLRGPLKIDRCSKEHVASNFSV